MKKIIFISYILLAMWLEDAGFEHDSEIKSCYTTYQMISEPGFKFVIGDDLESTIALSSETLEGTDSSIENFERVFNLPCDDNCYH